MGVSNFLSERAGVIRLSEVRVPKDRRGRGLGTQFMQELGEYADRTNQRIALSPSTDFGATSVTRLKQFYRRFGFVENKGRARDFTISDAMVRVPSGTSTRVDPDDQSPAVTQRTTPRLF